MKKKLFLMLGLVLIISFLMIVEISTGIYFQYEFDYLYNFRLDNLTQNQSDINYGIFMNSSNGNNSVGGLGILNNSMLFTGSLLECKFNCVNITAGFNFTMSAWFNYTGDTSGTIISEKANNGGSNNDIEVTSAGYLRYVFRNHSSSGFVDNGLKFVDDGGWHHVLVTTNLTGLPEMFIEYWVDGELNHTYNISGFTNMGKGWVSPTIIQPDIYIGGKRNSGTIVNLFGGFIDEVLIYNRSISRDEVQQIYNNGKPLGINILNITNQYYEPIISSGDDTFYQINYTLSNYNFNSVTTTININGTNHTASNSINGKLISSSYSDTIPMFNNGTIREHSWNIILSNGFGVSNPLTYNTNWSNQSIVTILIDNCTSYNVPLMNLTIVDEDDQTPFSSGGDDNVSVKIDITLNNGINFNQTFSELNPIYLCTSEDIINNIEMDATIQYSAFDHVSEFYNYQDYIINSTTIPINQTLYDLASTTSQEFLITYKDSSFLPVADALIEITRKYVGENVFKSVERPSTDQFGQTIGHFVLSDEVYTIIVSKNGVILATFQNVYAVCQSLSTGECEINLNEVIGGIQAQDFSVQQGVYYTLSYNQATDMISSTFSTVDGGTATISLNVTTLQGIKVCSNQLTSSAGTLSCSVASVQNQTVVATLIKVGSINFIGQAFYHISDFVSGDTFGASGVILALIMFITLPLMAITDRIMMIVFAMLGMIIAIILGLIAGGSIIGLGSTVMWFVIAGVILIWKIGRIQK